MKMSSRAQRGICFPLFALCVSVPRWQLISAEFFLQQFIELLRIGLPAGRLHHLAHKIAEEIGLAGPVLIELLGACGDDRANDVEDFAAVRNLADAEMIERLARTFGRCEHLLENALGHLAR